MVYAKVLAVDQDQAAYEAMLPELSRHGYELHAATSHSRAVDLAAAHDYHAALVSISLLDVHVLLAELRDTIPNLPIILAPVGGSEQHPRAGSEIGDLCGRQTTEP